MDQDPEFKREMTRIVKAKDFLDDNYLSNELRVPETLLLETNACASLATNAIRGDIWDNFSSQSYKNLPSVGSITVAPSLHRRARQYEMPAGGRGYIRPASLVSVWSTAPFLLNNTIGDFYWSGSVADRMKSFDSGIERLLWPEKRKGDRKYLTASGKLVPGVIDVTSGQTYLRVPKGYLPGFLKPLATPLASSARRCSVRTGSRSAPSPAARRSTWCPTWISTGAARRSTCCSRSAATSTRCPRMRPTSRPAPPSPIWSIRCWRSASVRISWSIEAITWHRLFDR